ncbi:hypothetical protein F2Q69_00028258, partial [Brassica cretica]
FVCGTYLLTCVRSLNLSLLSKCQNIIPNHIEKLYEFDERLSQSTDKSKVRLVDQAAWWAADSTLFMPTLIFSKNLISGLGDVSGEEFNMFMDFLRTLSIFGRKAPQERMQELADIVEGHADLNSKFNVNFSCHILWGMNISFLLEYDDVRVSKVSFRSQLRGITSDVQILFWQVLDSDHIDRFISCLQIALPFFVRGAPGTKFLNYMNTHILPAFEKVQAARAEELDLLRALAEISSYTTTLVAHQMLPEIVQLLKKYMPARKTGEEMNFTYVECLLYVLNHMVHKVVNYLLASVEDLTKATMKKLIQGTSEHNKAMSAAKTDEEKSSVVLHAKAPSFIGDKSVSLSWKEATKTLASTTTGYKPRFLPNSQSSFGLRFSHLFSQYAGLFSCFSYVQNLIFCMFYLANNDRVKRPATGAGNNVGAKKGRVPNHQVVKKAFEGVSYGGGRGSQRGHGRGQGKRGGGGGGRSRGRGYC